MKISLSRLQGWGILAVVLLIVYLASLRHNALQPQTQVNGADADALITTPAAPQEEASQSSNKEDLLKLLDNIDPLRQSVPDKNNHLLMRRFDKLKPAKPAKKDNSWITSLGFKLGEVTEDSGKHSKRIVGRVSNLYTIGSSAYGIFIIYWDKEEDKPVFIEYELKAIKEREFGIEEKP